MSFDFDFLSSTDRPALLAINQPDRLAHAAAVLEAQGYKVHTVTNSEEFFTRFQQGQYQVVILDEVFDSGLPTTNKTLSYLQTLPMSLRRHATIFLMGASVHSMNAMEAFAHSVHAVINYADLGSLDRIVSTVVGDNDNFLNLYRQVQGRQIQGVI